MGMLVTNHVLAGAAIGAVVRNPAAAYAIGVTSHFAMDAVPHWGQPRDRAHWWRVCVSDGLTGLAVLGAVAALADPQRRVSVVAGALGAATPDADKPFGVVFGRSPWPAPVNRFHSAIQTESPRRMPQEFAVGVAGAALVAFLLRRGRR